MNIKQFLEECSRSPLFAGFMKEKGEITETMLKSLGFVRDAYFIPQDLLGLIAVISKLDEKKTKFIPPEDMTLENEYPFFNNRRSRYFALTDIVKTLPNRRLLMAKRLELEISNPNRGFKIDKIPVGKCKDKIGFIDDDNSLKVSGEYTDWLFRESIVDISPKEAEEKGFSSYGEYIVMTNKKLLNKVTDSLLLAWELPYRYKEAVIELLLWNRVIHAGSGIGFGKMQQDDSDFYVGYMTFDKDTTQGEIVEALGYELVEMQKDLRGKVRNKIRKPEDKDRTIAEYNTIKETLIIDGKPITNKAAFRKLGFKLGLSERGIQKRINDK